MNQNTLSEYQIAELIYKSIAKVITTEEQTLLDNWLSEESNLALYEKITNKENIQDKFAIYKQIETDRVYKNIENKISKSDKQFKEARFYNVLKYAAVFLIFLGLGYLYYTGYFSNDSNVLVMPNESITLQLENGATKIIKENSSSKILDANGNVVGEQDGTQIVYSNETKGERLVYNTLKVPYGKRFEVKLSDGSSVHLNAGTSLKYPVKFLKGHKREVFLKGEAFFDIAKDESHPFLVNTDALGVEVLGTQFNFSSYPEDLETDVVLVEGSVNLFAIEDKGNSVTLEPGFKGSYNKKETEHISTRQVITSIYTSWIDGELVFRNITFANILKKLERHFNVEIINRNAELSNEKFNASFRNEPIEKILEYFKITYNIDYSISENKILIN
ncbi:FecR family protein [Flavisericum labens]|uniref:FecR family protein n=1 Tax=Flavisericum labens TaxID=3377112 RepID=UPI00387AB7A0